MRTSEGMPPSALFEHLLKVVSSSRFLQKRGLGNEVPFFICAYDPARSVAIDQMREGLVTKLAERGVTVLEIDLYDLAADLLRQRGIWDQVLGMEASISKNELKELLQGVLDPETHLVPAIAQRMAKERFDVLFIAGIGEVFPYIRSHNVLNNLQSTATDQPTIMFFPGRYRQEIATGAALDLFGRLQDDKYYRAFDILRYEV
jgi:hypothetical protein